MGKQITGKSSGAQLDEMTEILGDKTRLRRPPQAPVGAFVGHALMNGVPARTIHKELVKGGYDPGRAAGLIGHVARSLRIGPAKKTNA